MAENLKEKLSSLSGKLKLSGSEVGKKVSTGMASVNEKMRDLFKATTPTDKLVEELTSEDKLLNNDGPDWSKIMDLCDAVRSKEISKQELAKAMKKRLMLKNQNAHTAIDTNARVQLLTLTLIEACVKNCDDLFAEISNEHVLDEMVKIVDDPSTPIVTRDKALKLIEAWGESAPQLRKYPMFEETYKSLKSRGVKFPLRDPESLAPIFTPPQSASTATIENNSLSQRIREEGLINTYGDLKATQTDELFHTARNSVDLLSTVLTSSPHQEALQDELTTTLIEQCHRSQFLLQRIIERVGNDEAMMFEALDINDALQKVLAKYEEMKASFSSETTLPLNSAGSTEETTIPSSHLSSITEETGSDGEAPLNTNLQHAA